MLLNGEPNKAAVERESEQFGICNLQYVADSHAVI